MYGQTSPGGVVNLVTKRPSFTRFGEAGVAFGSFGTKEAKLDGGGPIGASEDWAFRLTALARDSETQINKAENDRFYLAPSLTWQPSDATRWTVLADIKRDVKSSYNLLPYFGTVKPRDDGSYISRTFNAGDTDRDKYITDQASVSSLFEHAFNDVWTVRQNTRFTYMKSSQDLLYSSGYVPGGQTQLNRYAFDVDDTAKDVATDSQAQAKISTGPIQHTILVGFDYRKYYYDGSYYLGTPESLGGTVPPIDISNPIYGKNAGDLNFLADYKQNLSQAGVYAQDQMKIFDRVIVTAGVRQDWIESKRYDRPSVTNPNGRSTNSNESALTGRGALGYLFENGLFPYVSYSTSFQPTSAAVTVGSPKPTEGEQYEIGAKYQPPGMNAFITAAAFDLTRSNVPKTVGLETRQIGEVRVRGVELEGVASIWNTFNLRASYTYLDPEVTKTTIVTEKGKNPVIVPNHVASLWADYTIPYGKLKGLGAGAGVRYVGKSYADPSNTYRNPSYTLLDAEVHYETDRWRLGVNGSNITDKRYAQCNGSANACFWGVGRRVLASAKYKF